MTHFGSNPRLAVAAVFAIIALPALGEAQDVSIPNFSPSPDVGWISYGPEYIPPPTGPGPIASDPTHPLIANAGEYFGGRRPGASLPERQGQFGLADLSNPILQPWAREELSALNNQVLSGRPRLDRKTGCWPTGVPAFNLYVVLPIYFVQTPAKVLMISQEDNQVRHIYLNVSHTANPKPSWNGESVGHFEGDTLVVDTIGMNAKTFIDTFRTPHSAQLHVVERFRLIQGGSLLEVDITVTDPVAFTTPWTAIQRFRRTDSTDSNRGNRVGVLDGLAELRCAENTLARFTFESEPIPTADKSDF